MKNTFIRALKSLAALLSVAAVLCGIFYAYWYMNYFCCQNDLACELVHAVRYDNEEKVKSLTGWVDTTNLTPSNMLGDSYYYDLDADQWPPHKVAIRRENSEMLNLLLNTYPVPAAFIQDEHSILLDLGLKTRNVEIVELLFTHGVNIGKKSINVALEQDQPEEASIAMLQCLITHGATVTADNFITAVRSKSLAVVEFLFKKVTLQPSELQHALLCATLRDLDVMLFLIEKNKNHQCLMITEQHLLDALIMRFDAMSRLENLKVLLSYKDPTISVIKKATHDYECLSLVLNVLNKQERENILKSEHAQSILCDLVNRNYSAITLELLLENGLQPNNAAKLDGKTPLMYAMENRDANGFKVAQLLLSLSDNINAQDNHNNTALMFAIRANNSNTFKNVNALLEKNALVDLQNQDGDTALIAALKNNNSLVALALLTAGANPEIPNLKGETATSIFYHAARTYEEKEGQMLNTEALQIMMRKK